MSFRQEAYFPYVDTSASDEARRASRAANANKERLAEIENEQQRHFSSQEGALQSLRSSVGSMARVIGDLEHRIEVLFKKDEKQTINVQSLQGQTSEMAAVIVDLSAKLEANQEVQKEVVECLVQMREALVAIAEHVAAMEAGGKEVAGIIEGILADEIDGGLQGGKDEEEGTVGLPRQTREYMAAVDILCREFWLYDEEAMRDFNFSTTPPQIRPEKRENFERSPIKEHRQRFAGEFHGVITENDFRTFLCENPEAEGFVFANRVFYRERTKDKYNELVEIICDNILENRQEELGNHPA